LWEEEDGRMIRMFTLSLKDTGAILGTIDDGDLQLLVDQLEEEHDADADYYVCPDTIGILAESGASASLLRILKDAVGSSEGVEVSWKKA
jgi:hypothetical protein